MAESARSHLITIPKQITGRPETPFLAKTAFGNILSKRTVAEFFAGIGLMRMGLEAQGWRVVVANDIDAQKEAMYNGHFHTKQDAFILSDIHNLSAALIPSVSLATASFPCTDLSLAGGRNGLNGKQSSAFWGFVHLLEKMGTRKPPLILLENVTGFLTSNKGHDFHQALLALNQQGYYIDAFIINAAHFVPQSRERLFLIGIQSHLAQAMHRVSIGNVQEDQVRPKALVSLMKAHTDIQWAIGALPRLPHAEQQLATILEDIPEHDQRWWSEARATYLLNQMSEKHRALAEKMIHEAQWTYGTVFRRMRNHRSMAELRTDNIAGCLRTPKGGSAKQILFKAGRGHYQVRLLTPLETARLMGANDYILPQNSNQALFGFGDAICVPVVSWIAQHYLNPLVDELLGKKKIFSSTS